MTSRACQQRVRNIFIFLAVAGAIAASLSFTAGKQPLSKASGSLAQRRPTGYPQLVSVESLPPMEDGPMCEWVHASGPLRLVAAIQQERLATTGAAKPPSADVRTATALERAPLRAIRDPYPTYSAVAVDPLHNEIVLQDENLFQIMVYDRQTNTPPGATMSEPKRVIGGHRTKMEFNCALYIDPKTGDIYSINNDTIDTLVTFSRNARGDVAPDRELRTPHRTYGIAVDEGADELFMTVQHPPTVLVHHKNAKGDDKPIRVLRGNKTHLQDAHGIALDTKSGLMFISNYGNAADYVDGLPEGEVETMGGRMVPGSGKYAPPSITVYPIKARGDAAPLRVIEGPQTRLNWPAHLSVDSEHGELYVANDADDSILVFQTTDNGDVAPQRILKGLKTRIKNPTGVFVDTVNNELVVSNMGNHSAVVFPRTAEGDVAPIRMIRGGPLGKPALQIGNPGAVAYDSKREEILVPN